MKSKIVSLKPLLFLAIVGALIPGVTLSGESKIRGGSGLKEDVKEPKGEQSLGGGSTGGGDKLISTLKSELWRVVERIENSGQTAVDVSVLKRTLRAPEFEIRILTKDQPFIDPSTGAPISQKDQSRYYAYGSPNLIQFREREWRYFLSEGLPVDHDLAHELLRATNQYDDNNYRLSIDALRLDKELGPKRISQHLAVDHFSKNEAATVRGKWKRTIIENSEVIIEDIKITDYTPEADLIEIMENHVFRFLRVNAGMKLIERRFPNGTNNKILFKLIENVSNSDEYRAAAVELLEFRLHDDKTKLLEVSQDIARLRRTKIPDIAWTSAVDKVAHIVPFFYFEQSQAVAEIVAFLKLAKTKPNAKAVALESLVRLEDEAAINEALQMLFSEDSDERAWAARCIEYMRASSQILENLVKALLQEKDTYAITAMSRVLYYRYVSYASDDADAYFLKLEPKKIEEIRLKLESLTKGDPKDYEHDPFALHGNLIYLNPERIESALYLIEFSDLNGEHDARRFSPIFKRMSSAKLTELKNSFLQIPKEKVKQFDFILEIINEELKTKP